MDKKQFRQLEFIEAYATCKHCKEQIIREEFTQFDDYFFPHKVTCKFYKSPTKEQIEVYGDYWRYMVG